MIIYTSYFGKNKALHAKGIVPICIALGVPRYMKVAALGYVAPKRHMLDDKWTDEEYVAMYRNEVLAKVDIKRLLEDLELISQGRDVALCCYEKPGEFCHRKFLAQWITEKTKIEVEEFDYTPIVQPKKIATQKPLF